MGNFIGGALDLVEVHYGFGRSMYYLSDYQIQEYGKYVYGEWLQTFATLMFTKVSICLFLLRIPITKVLIRPLQAAVVFLVVTNIVFTLLWILQCSPVEAAWHTEIHGRCFGRGQLERIVMAQASRSLNPEQRLNNRWLTTSVISIISDILFALYPVFILWSVQMKIQTKLSLWALMGLGVM